MILKLEFDKNIKRMRCDLNSVIAVCTNLSEGTEENLSEDSQSRDGYPNVKKPRTKSEILTSLDTTLTSDCSHRQDLRWWSGAWRDGDQK